MIKKYPCQNLLGGTGEAIYHNEDGFCDHPECNPKENKMDTTKTTAMQIATLADHIEARLNDYEAGFVEKEETIISFAYYIGERVETAVKSSLTEYKTELLTAIEIIMDKHPLTHDHQEDGRYTYPDRWAALVAYINKGE